VIKLDLIRHEQVARADLLTRGDGSGLTGQTVHKGRRVEICRYIDVVTLAAATARREHGDEKSAERAHSKAVVSKRRLAGVFRNH
jgi:hypothetical protein